jgi:hypothetical protein
MRGPKIEFLRSLSRASTLRRSSIRSLAEPGVPGHDCSILKHIPLRFHSRNRPPSFLYSNLEFHLPMREGKGEPTVSAI